MDSFVFNKILGAVLGVVFLAFSASIVSDWLFHAPVPEQAGYAIEETEVASTAAPEEAAVPIANLLQNADVSRGENAFKKCTACHSGEKGGPNKVGPDLWDIVNRPIATHEGFAYSGPMKEFSQGGQEPWTFEHLNDFLLSPRGLIRGTAMGFAGIKNDGERADLIAYLHSLSDNPVPLPEPVAEGAEGAAPTEGEQPATAGEQPAQQGGEQPAPQPQTEGGEPPVQNPDAPTEPPVQHNNAPVGNSGAPEDAPADQRPSDNGNTEAAPTQGTTQSSPAPAQ